MTSAGDCLQYLFLLYRNYTLKGYVMHISHSSKYSAFSVLLLMLTCFGNLSAKDQKSASETTQVEQSKTQKSVERTVYGVSVIPCPYVRRVRVALNEKQLPYTYKEILPAALRNKLQQPLPEDFKQASPLGKIPAYREGDWAITDSAVITQYLDKKYPEHKLYPTDPREYAQALWFEKYGDEVLTSVIHTKIFVERFVKPQVRNEKANEELVQKALTEELPPLLDYLESQLQNKQWLAGNNFSIADIAVVTHFISLDLAGEKFNEQRWPKLAAYIKRVLERPSFKQMQ